MSRNASVKVNLTPREKAALVTYCQAVDATVSGYVRAIVLPMIPAPYWERLAPPPGQLTIQGTDVDG